MMESRVTAARYVEAKSLCSLISTSNVTAGILMILRQLVFVKVFYNSLIAMLLLVHACFEIKSNYDDSRNYE